MSLELLDNADLRINYNTVKGSIERIENRNGQQSYRYKYLKELAESYEKEMKKRGIEL